MTDTYGWNTRSFLTSERHKRVTVVRWGAWGDTVIITPLLSRLKQDGFYVTLQTNPTGRECLKHSPNVDKFEIMDPGSLGGRTPEETGKKISEYLVRLARERVANGEEFINLNQSIEEKFMISSNSERDEGWQEKKDEWNTDINYFDYALELGGYKTNGERVLPEFHMSTMEKKQGFSFRKKYKKHFVIMLALEGSSPNKVYPWWFAVFKKLFFETEKRGQKITLLTVGSYTATLLERGLVDFMDEWKHRIVRRAGLWTHRKSCLMTAFVDLVVGPETGVLVTSGCFKTPKLALLTHSNKNNWPKYFLNDFSLQSPADCSPCHRIVHERAHCPESSEEPFSVKCMGDFPPIPIHNIIAKIYKKRDVFRKKFSKGGYYGFQ